jgi:hypothetical protein
LKPIFACLVALAASQVECAIAQQHDRGCATVTESNVSLSFLDEEVGYETTSFDAIRSEPFKNFACSVWKRVRDSGPTQDQLYLKFLRRPLVWVSQERIDRLEARLNARQICLNSPWITIAKDNSRTTAVVVWSERQILLDQATLSGLLFTPPPELAPFDRESYFRFLEDYSSSVLRAPGLDEARRARAEFETRAPPDLAWLFKHATQSTRGDFSVFVSSALNATLNGAADGYAELVIAMINRECASGSSPNTFETISEISPAFDAGKIRVH